MAVINRVPKGLLGLFDSKTGGRTPTEISNEVTVGIEGLLFYAADIPYSAEAVLEAAVVGIGSFALVEVPATELWLVYGVDSRVTDTTAGRLHQVAPAYQEVGTGIVTLTNSTRVTTTAIGQGTQAGVSWTTPLVAGPGTTFGSYEILAGVAATYVTTCMVKKLQV